MTLTSTYHDNHPTLLIFGYFIPFLSPVEFIWSLYIGTWHLLFVPHLLHSLIMSEPLFTVHLTLHRELSACNTATISLRIHLSIEFSISCFCLSYVIRLSNCCIPGKWQVFQHIMLPNHLFSCGRNLLGSAFSFSQEQSHVEAGIGDYAVLFL